MRIVEGDTNTTGARTGWSATRHDSGEAETLRRDAHAFYHQVLSTPCLAEVVEAEGPWLTLADGSRLLDFHGNSVHQVGYRNPEVLEAVAAEAGTLPFSPRRFANRRALELAEHLIDVAPGDLRGDARVLLVPSGALAVGLAVKVARAVTGRHKTLGFVDAFHGASLDAASVGGQDLFTRGMGPMMQGALHTPPPGDARCARCKQGCCDTSCVAEIESLLASREIAAFVAEPIRATTIARPPADYWHRVRTICDATGTLLIFDEIPTGLARSGEMWVSDLVGVTPDILVTGKGLGGAVFPQAGIVGRSAFNDGGVTPIRELAIGHYTHEKSPLGAAASLAVLRIIERDGLAARAESLGASWEAELKASLGTHPAVRTIRRVGLMLAIDLQSAGDPARPADEIANRAMYASLARGLSYKVGGGSTLVLGPPLTIVASLLSRATEIFAASLDEAVSVG